MFVIPLASKYCEYYTTRNDFLFIIIGYYDEN
jgi:hypothetical protein